MQKLQRKNVIKIGKKNYEFVKEICSRSGYDFHELYYINANRYFTCLQIFEFPEKSYSGMLNKIIENGSCLVMIDVTHLTQDDYSGKIDKTIKKSDNEEDDHDKSYTKARKARKNTLELLEFNDYIDESKDTVKTITLRIYVFGKTKDDLQDNLDDIINMLNTLKMTGNYIQTNNLTSDVKALTKMDNPIKKMVASDTVCDMMMRDEISIIDRCVGLLGKTTNGLYAPNFYTFANYSYSKIFVGGMGSGKSAFVKKINKNMELRGNHINYIFDIHNEYADYADALDMPSVGINADNHINFCQIFYTENEDGIIRKSDITNKIAIITETFISFNGLNRQEHITLIKQFKKHLRDFFNPYLNRNINELTNGDWFILKSVMVDLQSKIKNDEYKEIEKPDIYVLELCMDEMLEEYGSIFNCVTNIDFDLTRSLRFDVSFLRNNSNTAIKSAYMGLLLDYVSYGAYLNMRRNSTLMQRMGVKPYQLKEPLITLEITIDETMEYVDRAFLSKINALHKFLRKAYGAYTFVIHDTNDTEKSLAENGDLLSQLFTLCANKIIGKVDNKSAHELVKLIPEFNVRDANIVSKFKKGKSGERSFLVVDGQGRKTVVYSLITTFEQSYFGGGA